jgi:hypothetical protein
MMPEKDANEMAKTSRVRLTEPRVGFAVSDEKALLPTLRSRRGVCSVARELSLVSEMTGIVSRACLGRGMFIDEGESSGENESDRRDLSLR